jgi:hypothetical protein
MLFDLLYQNRVLTILLLTFSSLNYIYKCKADVKILYSANCFAHARYIDKTSLFAKQSVVKKSIKQSLNP